MPRAWLVAVLGAALAAPLPLTAELPFRTEEASVLPPGQVSIDLGLALREQPRDYGVPDRDRQLNLGTGRLRWSLGRIAELQISGTLLMLMETDGQRQKNWGDWTIGTKIRLLAEGPRRPGLGLLWEVKIPLASDEKGGATDETDFFAHLLFSQRLGPRWQLHGNLGIGVLGHPETLAAQNDVLIARLGLEYRIGERGMIGLEGLLQSGPRETDDPMYLRGVGSGRIGRWELHGAVGVGFGESSDDFVAEAGVRRRFEIGRTSENRR